MDLIADLAEPLPCIVTAEMFGVPVEDHNQLKVWSQDFAEMLGNFEHDADCVPRILKSTEDMTAYFRAAMRKENLRPDGLVSSLANAEINGDRLTEEEVIANCIITLIGGQETTTNLIASGTLTLLRNPDQLAQRHRLGPASWRRRGQGWLAVCFRRRVTVDLAREVFGREVMRSQTPTSVKWVRIHATRPPKIGAATLNAYFHSGVYAQRVGRSAMYCATRGMAPRLGLLPCGRD